jgi:hypothetical protein
MTATSDISDALYQKAKQGYKGYPIATVAFYGKDNLQANKIAVGIVTKFQTVGVLQRWFTETGDIRDDVTILKAITDFIEHHQAKSVMITDGIVGCPHEAGIDYPKGQKCPTCDYWATR